VHGDETSPETQAPKCFAELRNRRCEKGAHVEGMICDQILLNARASEASTGAIHVGWAFLPVGRPHLQPSTRKRSRARMSNLQITQIFSQIAVVDNGFEPVYSLDYT